MEKVLAHYLILPDVGINIDFKLPNCDHVNFSHGKQYTLSFCEVVDEPCKIKTEYEWKKERYDLLKSLDNFKDHAREIKTLGAWLKKNKPVQWATCTKLNTKYGDKVRLKVNPSKTAFIEHIFREMPCCSVWFEDEGKTVVNFTLESFEIDLNDKKEAKCQS